MNTDDTELIGLCALLCFALLCFAYPRLSAFVCGQSFFFSLRLSNLCQVKQEPREKAAADDDDDWFSWHDPLIGGMGAGLYRCTSMPAGALVAAPERKVRGTLAARGTPSGIQALTCVTPAYTRPANVAAHGGASMPPTFTLQGAAGAGSGGPEGRRPSAIAGVRTPSPVTKKVITEPGAGGTKSALQESTPPALSLITRASQGLLGQTKMPGNAAATGSATGAVAVPWYSTCIRTVPLTEYGTMALTWPAEA